MTNTNQQTHFWEVALMRDRDQFLVNKRGERHLASYVKGNAKPVRLNRNAKCSMFATVAVDRVKSRLDKRAGR